MEGIDIDFIKKCFDKAEGFEYEDGFILLPGPLNSRPWNDIKSATFKEVYYPLLLQRAIEGINRDLKYPYKINTDHNNIEVYHHDMGMMDGWILEDQDEAKEKALKYIFKQEKSNA